MKIVIIGGTGLIGSKVVEHLDPRKVLSDGESRYFGGQVGDTSLVPVDEARLGQISFDKWITTVSQV